MATKNDDMPHEAGWNSGFYNNQDKPCWKHSVSLPNVGPGISGLRGSRTVVGTDQKYGKQRDFKIYGKLEHLHPNNLTCISILL